MGNLLASRNAQSEHGEALISDEEFEPQNNFRAKQGVPSCFSCETHTTTIGKDQIQIKRSIPFQRETTNLRVEDVSLCRVANNDFSIPTLVGSCWLALLIFIAFIVVGKLVDAVDVLVTVGAIGLTLTVLFVIWQNYGAVVEFNGDDTAFKLALPFALSRGTALPNTWAKIPPHQRKELLQAFVDQKNTGQPNTGAQPVVIKATSTVGPLVDKISTITVSQHHVHVLNQGGYGAPCGMPEKEEEMAFAIRDIDWVHCSAGASNGELLLSLAIGVIFYFFNIGGTVNGGCAYIVPPANATGPNVCAAANATAACLAVGGPVPTCTFTASVDGLQTNIIVAVAVAVVFYIITSMRSGAPVVFALKGGAKCKTMVQSMKVRKELTSLINARQLGRAPQEDAVLQKWKGGAGEGAKGWNELCLFAHTLEFNSVSAGCCGCCCIGELQSYNVVLSNVRSLQSRYSGNPAFLFQAILFFAAWVYTQFVSEDCMFGGSAAKGKGGKKCTDDEESVSFINIVLPVIALLECIAFYCSKQGAIYVAMRELNYGGMQTSTQLVMKGLESKINGIMKGVRDQQKLNMDGGAPPQ